MLEARQNLCGEVLVLSYQSLTSIWEYYTQNDSKRG